MASRFDIKTQMCEQIGSHKRVNPSPEYFLAGCLLQLSVVRDLICYCITNLVVSWLVCLLLPPPSKRWRRVGELGSRIWRWYWLKVLPILYEGQVCNFLPPIDKFRRKSEVSGRSIQNLLILSGHYDQNLRPSLQRESAHWQSREIPVVNNDSYYSILKWSVLVPNLVYFFILSRIVVAVNINRVNVGSSRRRKRRILCKVKTFEWHPPH